MTCIKINNSLTIETIGTEEIIQLHDSLSSHPDIIELSEPIHPKGIKNIDVLESAVFRQLGGSGEFYEYSNIYSNCATLLFGVTKNHSFHNGNKRAGFLSMLMHLYKNGKVLDPKIKNDDIYSFLKKLADKETEFIKFAKQKHRKLYNGVMKNYPNWDDRSSVYFIELWLKQIAISKTQLNRPLKWNNFFEKLRSFNLEIEISNNTFTISKIKDSGSIFKRNKILTSTYSYNGSRCNPRTINSVRRDFDLTKENGIDNSVFFNSEIYLDEILTEYKKLIYKLSLT